MDLRSENADDGITYYLQIPDAQGGSHDTALFIPFKFQNDPRMRLILYFHGYTDGRTDLRSYMHRTPAPLPLRKIVANDGRFAFAMPWLGMKCENYRHLTGSSTAFDAYVAALNTALMAFTPNALNFLAPRFQLVLAAHSGGGDILSHAVGLPPGVFMGTVTDVWALDCFYPYTTAPAWTKWAAANKGKSLSIFYKGTAAISSKITGTNVKAAMSAAGHDNIPEHDVPGLLRALR